MAHAGGRLIAGAAAPTGETRSTGYIAGEPTLGIFKDGTIVYMGIGALVDAVAVVFGQSAILRSRDQGRTWQVLDHLTPGSDEEQTGGDPFLRVDRDTGRMFQLNWTPPCTQVSMSDDEGDTFSTGVVCNHADHQTCSPASRSRARPRNTRRSSTTARWTAARSGASTPSLGARSRSGTASRTRPGPSSCHAVTAGRQTAEDLRVRYALFEEDVRALGARLASPADRSADNLEFTDAS